MPDPYTTPSPPPAPSATRHRRRRGRHLLSPFSTAARASSPSAMSSSAASSPASSAGLSLFSFSRSPSPFHHLLLSPLHYASSAVPFAWEHRPGVPKTPTRQTPRANSRRAAKAPLPLPPALLISGGSSKVGAAADDCFVVSEELLLARERRRRGRARRQPALAAATLADWFAVLSLCQSCTMSRDGLAGKPPQSQQRAMAKAGWSDCDVTKKWPKNQYAPEFRLPHHPEW
ncbi:hypothetical protein EJB05_37956, partial [Eragrostis curvula]